MTEPAVPQLTRITITEALAEIKTIAKRLEKKREFVRAYAVRSERMRDPLTNDGGSEKVLAEQGQSIDDLVSRAVNLRLAILQANLKETITIGGDTHTIQWWLTWRREQAEGVRNHLSALAKTIADIRKEAQAKGAQVFAGAAAVAQVGQVGPIDVVVNINEKNLGAAREHLESVLGDLDGQLSLKNATMFVELP